MLKRTRFAIGAVLCPVSILSVLLAVHAFEPGASRPLVFSELALAILIAVAVIVLVGVQNTSSVALSRNREEISLLSGQLQEQGQAIDFLADGLDLGIFICDESGTVSYANRTARNMFQFSNPTGRSLLAITVSYDLEQLVLSAVKSQSLESRELIFPRPQERNAVAKAWMNPDSKQVFVSIFDVSNLRRLERVRQDFVANVSHELRTPMAIIRAYAETLLDDEEPNAERLQNYLPKMIAEVDRLSGLTRDLLILSAAELEVVQKQRCNIGALCDAVVAQLEPKAESKNLELRFNGSEDCIIEANPSQMTQVILNLIDNALNYTVKGSVDVILESHSDPITIKVVDTGIGIASEHAARIFERFYRVDKGRSRSTGGTGLGLSIVKHIVEAHDGNVRLDSALNEGSTFTVLAAGGHSAPWTARIKGERGAMNLPLISARRTVKSIQTKGLIVLLHGLGSDEQDLLSLSDYLDPRFEIVSLRAPMAYGPGYKWFSLDVSAGRVSYDLIEARKSLTKVVESIRILQDQLNLGPSNTVLGGFSQGAMLGLGITLVEANLNAYAWLMSGATIPELRAVIPPREDRVSVLVQHGLTDDVVPIERGYQVRDLLGQLDFCDTLFRSYPMGHSISAQSIQDAAEWLSEHFPD